MPMLQNIQAEFAENLMDAMLDQNKPTDIHFKIYQNNVITTLLSVLKSVYPLICKLLGEDFFLQCAQEYIRSYPSRTSNLHDYGEYFAGFLGEYELTNHLLYLPEVAEFEWICHYLHFAADHPPLDIAKLETITPEVMDQLRFMLHPASALKEFHYPILRIIELCKGELDDEIDIEQGGVKLLIIRRELDIKLAVLTSAEFTCLQCLNEGHALSDALLLATQASQAHPAEAEFKLEEKLPLWVRDKTLVDCY